jgi:EAL domain-containing protein (putative c-di-GMP-specific phosphodiesterase class I)
MRALRCDLAQGYVLTPAISGDDLAAWMHRRATSPVSAFEAA